MQALFEGELFQEIFHFYTPNKNFKLIIVVITQFY